jgi:hypothetical protein
MKRLASISLATASLALVACGDNLGTGVDSGGGGGDGGSIDAETDAPPPTFSGTISLLEAQVLAPGSTGAQFGQGVQASIAFTSSAQVPGPVMEEQAGSPFGCKVFEYNVAQSAAATVGVDEGPVTFTLAAGAGQHPIPTCTHRANVGYTCPHANTAGTGGTIDAITQGQGAGTATLTVTGTPFNAMNTDGKYVNITGAAMATNNGTFPILGSSANNVITYANPVAVDETLPAAATRVNLGGVGPIPGETDDGFLVDNNTASFAHTMGGGGHFADFTMTTGAGTIGDDFDLANTEAAKLNAVPRDGLAFSVTCSAAECPVGSASGTILQLVTTDAPVPALPSLFFVMPQPMTKRVIVRCAALQGNTAGQTITVPAPYMARIMTAGATRIQASFIRPQLMGSDPVTAISGHAIVGFTTPTP